MGDYDQAQYYRHFTISLVVIVKTVSKRPGEDAESKLICAKEQNTAECTNSPTCMASYLGVYVAKWLPRMRLIEN